MTPFKIHSCGTHYRIEGTSGWFDSAESALEAFMAMIAYKQIFVSVGGLPYTVDVEVDVSFNLRSFQPVAILRLEQPKSDRSTDVCRFCTIFRHDHSYWAWITPEYDVGGCVGPFESRDSAETYLEKHTHDTMEGPIYRGPMSKIDFNLRDWYDAGCPEHWDRPGIALT